MYLNVIKIMIEIRFNARKTHTWSFNCNGGSNRKKSKKIFPCTCSVSQKEDMHPSKRCSNASGVCFKNSFNAESVAAILR